MIVLPLLGYTGLALGFGFLTLSIASGLYYISELVEEHTVIAKKVLTNLIYVVVGTQLLLAVVDGAPWTLTAMSIVSQGIYYQNLRTFPIVKLSDPIFLLSCILVVVNHYFWFVYFSNPYPFKKQSGKAPNQYYGTSYYHDPADYVSFTQVAAFFFLQVWLIPFAFFVSLSAADNVLPSMGSEYATNPNSPLATPSISAGSLSGFLSPRSATSDARRESPMGKSLGHSDGRSRRKGGAKGLVRVAVDNVRNWVSESGDLLGLWKSDSFR